MPKQGQDGVRIAGDTAELLPESEAGDSFFLTTSGECLSCSSTRHVPPTRWKQGRAGRTI